MFMSAWLHMHKWTHSCERSYIKTRGLCGSDTGYTQFYEEQKPSNIMISLAAPHVQIAFFL